MLIEIAQEDHSPIEHDIWWCPLSTLPSIITSGEPTTLQSDTKLSDPPTLPDHGIWGPTPLP